MTAVPERRASGPVVGSAGRTGPRTGPARIVAVAESITELYRPESDLVRILESVAMSDLLIACDDRAPRPGPPCVPTPLFSYLDYPDYDDRSEDDDLDDDQLADAPHQAAEPMAARDAAELPGLRLHRLGLPSIEAASEDDLVAAMSELVGFDPEPGVYCLAPVGSPDDVSRSAVIRAAERIARVYGLPMLQYRCLELAVVPDEH